MKLYLDSKLFKAQPTVVSTPDSIGKSPIKGVGNIGRGSNYGSRGGMVKKVYIPKPSASGKPQDPVQYESEYTKGFAKVPSVKGVRSNSAPVKIKSYDKIRSLFKALENQGMMLNRQAPSPDQSAQQPPAQAPMQQPPAQAGKPVLQQQAEAAGKVTKTTSGLCKPSGGGPRQYAAKVQGATGCIYIYNEQRPNAKPQITYRDQEGGILHQHDHPEGGLLNPGEHFGPNIDPAFGAHPVHGGHDDPIQLNQQVLSTPHQIPTEDHVGHLDSEHMPLTKGMGISVRGPNIGGMSESSSPTTSTNITSPTPKSPNIEMGSKPSVEGMKAGTGASIEAPKIQSGGTASYPQLKTPTTAPGAEKTAKTTPQLDLNVPKPDVSGMQGGTGATAAPPSYDAKTTPNLNLDVTAPNVSGMQSGTGASISNVPSYEAKTTPQLDISTPTPDTAGMQSGTGQVAVDPLGETGTKFPQSEAETKQTPVDPYGKTEAGEPSKPEMPATKVSIPTPDGGNVVGATSNSGNKHGLHSHYDKNNQLIRQENFHEGKKHGDFKEYHPDTGEEAISGKFVHGRAHGLFTRKDREGNILSTQNFEHGKKYGDQVTFDSEGKIKDISHYSGHPNDQKNEAGKITKDSIKDFPENKPFTTERADGKGHVLSEHPDFDNHRNTKVNYDNHAIHPGHEEIRHADGIHHSDIHKNDARLKNLTNQSSSPTSDFHFEEGDGIVHKGHFHKGTNTPAISNTFDAGGSKKYSNSYYKNGVIARHERVHTNGNRSVHTFNKEGAADGKHEFYGPDGKLSHAVHYKNGTPLFGHTYDDSGNIASTHTYSNGKVDSVQGESPESKAFKQNLSSQSEKTKIDHLNSDNAEDHIHHLLEQSGGPIILTKDSDHWKKYRAQIRQDPQKFNHTVDKDGNIHVHGVHVPSKGWVGTARGEKITPAPKVGPNHPLGQQVVNSMPPQLRTPVANLPALNAPTRDKFEGLKDFLTDLAATDYRRSIALGRAMGHMIASKNPAAGVNMAFASVLNGIPSLAHDAYINIKKQQYRDLLRDKQRADRLDPAKKETLKKTKDYIKEFGGMHHDLEGVLGSTSHWSDQRHKEFHSSLDDLRKIYQEDLGSSPSDLDKYEAEHHYGEVLDGLIQKHRLLGAAEAGYHLPQTKLSPGNLRETHKIINQVSFAGGVSEKEANRLKRESRKWSEQAHHGFRRSLQRGLAHYAGNLTDDKIKEVLATSMAHANYLAGAEEEARKLVNKRFDRKDKKREKYSGPTSLDENNPYVDEKNRIKDLRSLISKRDKLGKEIDLYGKQLERHIEQQKAKSEDETRVETPAAEAAGPDQTASAVAAQEGEVPFWRTEDKAKKRTPVQDSDSFDPKGHPQYNVGKGIVETLGDKSKKKYVVHSYNPDNKKYYLKHIDDNGKISVKVEDADRLHRRMLSDRANIKGGYVDWHHSPEAQTDEGKQKLIDAAFAARKDKIKPEADMATASGVETPAEEDAAADTQVSKPAFIAEDEAGAPDTEVGKPAFAEEDAAADTQAGKPAPAEAATETGEEPPAPEASPAKKPDEPPPAPSEGGAAAEIPTEAPAEAEEELPPPAIGPGEPEAQAPTPEEEAKPAEPELDQAKKKVLAAAGKKKLRTEANKIAKDAGIPRISAKPFSEANFGKLRGNNVYHIMDDELTSKELVQKLKDAGVKVNRILEHTDRSDDHPHFSINIKGEISPDLADELNVYSGHVGKPKAFGKRGAFSKTLARHEGASDEDKQAIESAFETEFGHKLGDVKAAADSLDYLFLNEMISKADLHPKEALDNKFSNFQAKMDGAFSSRGLPEDRKAELEEIRKQSSENVKKQHQSSGGAPEEVDEAAADHHEDILEPEGSERKSEARYYAEQLMADYDAAQDEPEDEGFPEAVKRPDTYEGFKKLFDKYDFYDPNDLDQELALQRSWKSGKDPLQEIKDIYEYKNPPTDSEGNPLYSPGLLDRVKGSVSGLGDPAEPEAEAETPTAEEEPEAEAETPTAEEEPEAEAETPTAEEEPEIPTKPETRTKLQTLDDDDRAAVGYSLSQAKKLGGKKIKRILERNKDNHKIKARALARQRDDATSRGDTDLASHLDTLVNFYRRQDIQPLSGAEVDEEINTRVEPETPAAETPVETETPTPTPEAETPAEPEAEPEAETPVEPEAETPAEPEAEADRDTLQSVLSRAKELGDSKAIRMATAIKDSDKRVSQFNRLARKADGELKTLLNQLADHYSGESVLPEDASAEKIDKLKTAIDDADNMKSLVSTGKKLLNSDEFKNNATIDSIKGLLSFLPKGSNAETISGILGTPLDALHEEIGDRAKSNAVVSAILHDELRKFGMSPKEIADMSREATREKEAAKSHVQIAKQVLNKYSKDKNFKNLIDRFSGIYRSRDISEYIEQNPDKMSGLSEKEQREKAISRLTELGVFRTPEDVLSRIAYQSDSKEFNLEEHIDNMLSNIESAPEIDTVNKWIKDNEDKLEGLNEKEKEERAEKALMGTKVVNNPKFRRILKDIITNWPKESIPNQEQALGSGFISKKFKERKEDLLQNPEFVDFYHKLAEATYKEGSDKDEHLEKTRDLLADYVDHASPVQFLEELKRATKENFEDFRNHDFAKNFYTHKRRLKDLEIDESPEVEDFRDELTEDQERHFNDYFDRYRYLFYLKKKKEPSFKDASPFLRDSVKILTEYGKKISEAKDSDKAGLDREMHSKLSDLAKRSIISKQESEHQAYVQNAYSGALDLLTSGNATVEELLDLYAHKPEFPKGLTSRQKHNMSNKLDKKFHKMLTTITSEKEKPNGKEARRVGEYYPHDSHKRGIKNALLTHAERLSAKGDDSVLDLLKERGIKRYISKEEVRLSDDAFRRKNRLEGFTRKKEEVVEEPPVSAKDISDLGGIDISSLEGLSDNQKLAKIKDALTDSKLINKYVEGDKKAEKLIKLYGDLQGFYSAKVKDKNQGDGVVYRGINPTIKNFSEVTGIPEAVLRSAMPNVEEADVTDSQYRHLINGIHGIAEKHKGRSKKAAKKAAIEDLHALLQEHRDVFHPYTIDFVSKLRGDQTKKVLDRVYQAAEDIDPKAQANRAAAGLRAAQVTEEDEAEFAKQFADYISSEQGKNVKKLFTHSIEMRGFKPEYLDEANDALRKMGSKKFIKSLLNYFSPLQVKGLLLEMKKHVDSIYLSNNLFKGDFRNATEEKNFQKREFDRERDGVGPMVTPDDDDEILKAVAEKTNPELWERAKREAKAKMGGKHSARAMQLAVKIYKEKGGGYKGKKPSSKSNSLKKWTKQDWRWSKKGKGVYLPKEKISKLKSSEEGKKKLKSAERKKSKATKEGKQYSKHGLAAGTSMKKSVGLFVRL